MLVAFLRYGHKMGSEITKGLNKIQSLDEFLDPMRYERRGFKSKEIKSNFKNMKIVINFSEIHQIWFTWLRIAIQYILLTLGHKLTLSFKWPICGHYRLLFIMRIWKIVPDRKSAELCQCRRLLCGSESRLVQDFIREISYFFSLNIGTLESLRSRV